jgi:hypothetical protein
LTEYASVSTRYEVPPAPIVEGDRIRIRLPTDGLRAGARLLADVKRPALVRDALLTLADVLASDLRRKAADRSDYLAYLLKQGRRATKELWEAQKAYLDQKYAEEVDDEGPLDPLLTVSPDGLAIEVFSADESAYARLDLREGGDYGALEASPGTTHIDLSKPLLSAVSQLRSYRGAELDLSPSQAGAERAIRVPYRWIRALGQVQAASTLPAAVAPMAPIDFYNILASLRRRKAKKSPRALRYELVPGAPPRLVLEPWEQIIEGTAGAFTGSAPRVVRTWGRRRLSVLGRLLPHLRGVTVHLVGAGLPAYYVLDLGGGASLTLALSGWTDSGWAGIATFDLLVPGQVDDVLARQVSEALAAGPADWAALAAATRREPGDVRAAVLAEMQRGQVIRDLAGGRFRYRPLLAAPVDGDRLRYRDAREEAAHRLLATAGQVRLTTVHDLGGDGVRIEGEVEDRQAHRTYEASFTIDREGRTVDASCSSPQFRRSGLREGPTVPMIALRLLYARERARLEEARESEEGRKLIRAETRTLIRPAMNGNDNGNGAEGASTMRISLRDRRVTIRWIGEGADRMNQLFFTTADEAREEYFRRLEAVERQGYIDASAGELA